MSDHEVPAVGVFGGVLQQMLERGRSIEQQSIAEPPMTKENIGELWAQFDTIFPSVDTLESRKRAQWPIIETACRDRYNRLLVSSETKAAAVRT